MGNETTSIAGLPTTSIFFAGKNSKETSTCLDIQLGGIDFAAHYHVFSCSSGHATLPVAGEGFFIKSTISESVEDSALNLRVDGKLRILLRQHNLR